MSLLPPQHVLNEMAKDCRSCGICGVPPPCDTCMAGGVCFARCTCHEEDDERDADDFDDMEDEGRR